MHHSEKRILTSHVGSLVRTPEIVECQIRASLGESVDPRNQAVDVSQIPRPNKGAA
jgi:hypothetical protein